MEYHEALFKSRSYMQKALTEYRNVNSMFRSLTLPSNSNVNVVDLNYFTKHYDEVGKSILQSEYKYNNSDTSL